jgi:hypothetical protein
MKTKKETLELVENSPSSIFLKGDVISLINDLQDDDKSDSNHEYILDIINELKQDPCNMYFDYGAEFRIDNYNEVHVESVEINWDYISECIEKVVTKI